MAKMTGMTCMIRMNSMTINEKIWMAGMTGMTRMNRITWFTVITGVTGMIGMNRKQRITGASRMNGVMIN